MCTCPICFDTLTAPIALPCGHVFCHHCLVQTVRTTPACPTCRRPLPLAMADPTLIPAHLQPYFQPPLRRLYIDPCPTAPTDTDKERARLQAENTALRECCSRWRHFADTQAAAQRGLMSSGRAATAYARALREERDALSRECAALKRKRGVFDNAEDEHCGERPMKRLAGAGANVVPQRPTSGLPAGLAALMAGPIPVDVLDMCESLTRRSGPADLIR